MFPRPGPPRMTSTSTIGTSEAAMYDRPSAIRLTPGLDDDVIVRAPAQAAP